MPPLVEIADAVGTPFYLYDANVLKERINRLEAAFAGVPHLACYAVKANDALAILGLAAETGLGADIVSGGELAKALRAGFPPDRIVFSGVGKRREEIRAAIDEGVRTLNVESLGELEVVAEEARGAGSVARVAVRLNPDVDAETHAYVTTGTAGSKFGLGFADALEALERAAADDALEPVGVSFHIGSNIFELGPIAAAADRATELWRAAAGQGIELRELDAGGGLGVRHDPVEGFVEVDVDAWASLLTKTATRLAAELVVEPGRWLVAPAGTFVTRVLYTKAARGRTIAICDGAMNDLIRPALYDAYHPIDTVASGPRRTGPVDVVGPVCESGDFFALGRELPVPEPGDLLAVGLAGAYGRVMSSTYNARPLCAEVLLDGSEWRIVRERETVEDLMRGEAAPHRRSGPAASSSSG